MVAISFRTAEGAIKTFAANEGEAVLAAAQRAGLPLEGACGGALACATCHVIADARAWPLLAPASEAEEAMLALLSGVAPTSRLSCQILVTPALEGVLFHLPSLEE